MPVYEFCCDECGKNFDLVATLQEKEAGLEPVCPHCGGRQVHQIFSRFTVIGGTKDESDVDLSDIDEDYGAPDDEGLGEDEFGDEDLDDDLGENPEDDLDR